jgi:ketosteroid isomerase-like protein
MGISRDLARIENHLAGEDPQGEAVMKRFELVMVSLALFAVILGLAPAARADDQQAIADLEHKYANVTTPDEAKKYWDSGDDVVMFDIMPPREFAGKKAIDDHMDAFSGWKDVKVDFLELKVIGDGKLALARSVQHFTAKVDGKPFEMTYRQTHLWRKTHGHWKIIHEHDSVPVDMKTGKADMASKK